MHRAVNEEIPSCPFCGNGVIIHEMYESVQCIWCSAQASIEDWKKRVPCPIFHHRDSGC